MFPFPNQQPGEKPFRIALEQQEKKANGSFVPAAHIQISPVLRTSGLLRALPPEGVKSLLFLLTFVSPNGDCRAYLHQLARAMDTTKTKARNRMAHLAAFRWHGEPLAIETAHESGLVSYSLSPRFIEYSQIEAPLPVTQLPQQGGFREEVIAHSRKAYGRSRAEVEKVVARQLGHEVPQTEGEKARHELQRKLENTGIAKDRAQCLLNEYDHENIVRQLEWLPYRNAKNPAAYLIAAIEKDYAQPLAHRFRVSKPEGNDDEPPFIPKAVTPKPTKPKPRK